MLGWQEEEEVMTVMHTVKQLIEALQKQPMDALVFQSIDEEGNHFKTFDGISPAEVYEEDEDNVFFGNEPPVGAKYIVLWPNG
jgi:hypothetical protein